MAAKPLVTENTQTRVRSFQGRSVLCSAKPPHRSTTHRPARYTHRPAPTSWPVVRWSAKVRATAEFEAKAPDGSLRRFSTIGVDENVVDASWQALSDAIQYHLIETHAEAPA